MNIIFDSADSCACSFDLDDFVSTSASSISRITGVPLLQLNELVLAAILRKKLCLRDVAYGLSAVTSESATVVMAYSAIASALLTVEQLRPGVINSWARKKGA